MPRLALVFGHLTYNFIAWPIGLCVAEAWGVHLLELIVSVQTDTG